MLEYTLKESTRKKMATEHRAVQMAISVIANRSFSGHPVSGGIGKYNGGVRVNNCEICIHRTNVMDDWKRVVHQSTPEEIATVNAIAEVAKMIETKGLKAIYPYRSNSPFRSADPLRDMLDIKGDSEPGPQRPWWKKILSP